MNKEEANKIIAEYMGFCMYKRFIVTPTSDSYVNGQHVSLLYSESLDALVPVWEKLEGDKTKVNRFFPHDKLVELYREKPKEKYSPFDKFDFFTKEGGETIQEAAAIATAKAIKELK